MASQNFDKKENRNKTKNIEMKNSVSDIIKDSNL